RSRLRSWTSCSARRSPRWECAVRARSSKCSACSSIYRWRHSTMSSSTVATSPAEVIFVFSSALKDGRVADALALYEPDAVFVPQPNAPPIAGRADIREALARVEIAGSNPARVIEESFLKPERLSGFVVLDRVPSLIPSRILLHRSRQPLVVR